MDIILKSGPKSEIITDKFKPGRKPVKPVPYE
ncbi:MAG: hypothetical protein QG618_1430, partial [Thermodesulfobacteriota bacterium]|nr:hypothetical protein [Thermodesulfobacteriota bacterium]